jgi:hypothetical protein
MESYTVQANAAASKQIYQIDGPDSGMQVN